MSENFDQIEENIVKELQRFDLTEKDARVYLALLPRRDVGSSKIILATKLHKQFVYNSLAKLETLGLAKHVIQKGRKKFSANTPKRITSILDEKRLLAQTLVRQLQEKYIGAHEQDVEIFQGDSAFISHQMDLQEKSPENSEVRVIACETERFGEIFKKEDIWDEYENRRVKKNILVRYIGAPSQREVLKKREEDEKLFTYRILPGHSIGIVDTDIWHDNVTLNIFGNPVLSISITGQEIADGYRKFFETLWNLSTK
jgi:sugar-specific transcriptional regulator TrmB